MTAARKPAHQPDYDLFVDLSASFTTAEGLDRYLTVLLSRLLLARGQRLTAAIAGAAVVARDGQRFAAPVDIPPLGHALELAHLDGRGLFLLEGRWAPGAGVLSALADLASLDPNIGTVQPRFMVGQASDFMELPDPSAAETGTISGSLAHLLPDHYVTPEVESACMYVTPQAVPACPPVSAESAAEARTELFVGLRRRGFRNLVSNRHFVPYPLDPALAYPAPTDHGDAPYAADAAQGRAWLARTPLLRFEHLLAGSMSGERRRLLLDCRGMSAAHNGSSHAILGYLDGVARLHSDRWQVTVCVGRQAADFHRLTSRFPAFAYEYDRVQSRHLVALHLSQPWWTDMLIELHHAAPLIAFNILDTIAWDAIYPAHDALDQATRLAAAYADGLAYLSEHSRQRFRFRFSPHARMRETVTYLSTSRDDLGGHIQGVARQQIGILVMGNRLDHKDVDRTTSKLADAFPFTQIVAFGSEQTDGRPNVRSITSGLIDDSNVRDIFERASVIVYPSFSEGFGIPVVQGLARGKPVVVRELPLWDEIRRRTEADGRLRVFRTDAELVDAVARALDSGPAMPRRRRGRTISWADCGQTLLDFVEDLERTFSFDHWQARDLVLSRLARAELGAFAARET